MTEVLLRKGGWTRGAGGTWGAGKDGMLLLESHPMIMIWIMRWKGFIYLLYKLYIQYITYH